uniref:Capsid protein n=1 Tax=Parvoviridae sp. TaxID=1940570 RepID=A0A7D3UGJ7_9VIRU|nr:MAG: capsid protein [Parvoviridae sp.]
MEDYNITNCYMAYVDNEAMLYPSRDEHTVLSGNLTKRTIPTGWQIIPNLLWRHMCKPKQWYEMLIKYEAYSVAGIDCTLFNPIPITNNLSIGRTSLFAAFNNCIYCNTYTDELYETSWHPWYIETGTEADNLNLLYKEGVFYSGQSTTDGSTPGSYRAHVYKFPQYFWKRQFTVNEFSNQWSQGKEGQAGVFDTFNAQARNQQPIPAGLVWDPYERPEHIGELRAGKNASTYSWNIAGCDEGKIWNLDRIMDFSTWTTAGPYTGSHRPGTGKRYTDMDPEVITTFGAFVRNANSQKITPPEGVASAGQVCIMYEDYAIPNWANMPIVPNVWTWHEIKNSIADIKMDKAWQKIDKYWCGTENEQCKYPPCQWFIKGIPIYDAQESLIRTMVQLSVKITLRLKCKPRRSAYYCPTWGPFSGEQLFYHNPAKQIFQESYIRYRTGGGRRTWQNLQRTNQQNSKNIHGREDPYELPRDGNEITYDWYAQPTYPLRPAPGTGGAYSATDNPDNREIQITINQDGTSVARYKKPVAPTRTKQTSPEKYADVQMMEHLPSN